MWLEPGSLGECWEGAGPSLPSQLVDCPSQDKLLERKALLLQAVQR